MNDAVERTRLSWMRTMLGVVAVTALVIRGLLISDGGAWAVTIASVPALALVAVGASRQRGVLTDRAATRLTLAALALLGAVAVWSLT